MTRWRRRLLAAATGTLLLGAAGAASAATITITVPPTHKSQSGPFNVTAAGVNDATNAGMPSTAHIDAFDQLASIPCAADPSAEIGKGENDVFKDVAPGPYSITQATRVDLAGKRHICGYLSISHGSIDAGVKATDDKPYEVTAAASTTTPAHKKHAKKCKKK